MLDSAAKWSLKAAMNNLTGYALHMDVETPVIASIKSGRLLTWFY